VIPAPFDYVRPASLDEALALLGTHGDDAKVLAGGHSLLPAMKLRLAQPKLLVDIGRLADLRFIRKEGDRLVVGALSTHYEIESSALLKKECPLMPEVAAAIGDVQVRNRGTIGGSLAHADPAGDWAAAMLALDAEIDVAGAQGRRRIRAQEFFVDIFQSALGRNEILVAVRVPTTGVQVAYEKVANKASGFAICGVAVVSSPSLGIGVTGVATTPYRAASVDALTEGVDVLSDIHASGEFRAHLARVHAKRALDRAMRK
jgi:carbon-monoxide dehydrogenase medium subunit